ncbi:outer membrane protein OmpK [Pseudomonas schmalbachii]|uniref:Nucleoside-binding outer membrane protein n=1 Tax=Pseudomonas schmalbachii TaxID=2816993 RepID=A0ABS3TU90_9PSED|nr:outer membrane protein OmpK [Pseudomonas schmalbachii]MBO3276938.1 hypothetical protein [Pseudomonas schmalbachii]
MPLALYNPPPADVEELGTVGQARSASPLLFMDNSITYLWGKDFQVDPHIQQTVTLEHFSLWNWGDVFAFVDNTWFNGGKSINGSHAYYGELTPRFSIGKLSGRDLSFGPVKDVLLATTYEFGEGDVETFRFGPGFDLAIPGFDFFKLNFYYRMPQGNRSPDGVWQVVPAWSTHFPVGKSDIILDGVIHWAVNSKDAETPNQQSYHKNLHINPQVKYDLGKALGSEPRKLLVGIEYDYWSNKYGIEDSKFFDTNQSATSLLLQYHF